MSGYLVGYVHIVASNMLDSSTFTRDVSGFNYPDVSVVVSRRLGKLSIPECRKNAKSLCVPHGVKGLVSINNPIWQGFIGNVTLFLIERHLFGKRFYDCLSTLALCVDYKKYCLDVNTAES